MMNLTALPVYVQIAEEIRQNITQGVYRVGEKLPTENQLSIRFNVNRHTLRRAIGVLRDEGILRVDQGRGTFVAAAPIRYNLGERMRYNEALKAQGLKPSFQFLRTIEVPADKTMATELEMKEGQPVARVERLALADEQPISVSSHHFPSHLFPNLLEHFQEIKSISQVLKSVYNCDHLRRTTRISARTVKPEDARVLKLPHNNPILLAESVNVDQKGRVIEYGTTRFRGDRMELVLDNSSFAQGK